ncbi:nucleoside triphosphate pyrophosphatase [Sedimentibacter sp. MB31-C6]|uniref:nucleoside triphosphate pyrophosphatase n=1 Tax=Sedimentibacter sp. MB31-C6 TaxID=3109366 RepID=UPI002DDD0DB6|nr:Maf family protein [Sedimentibacter sp. MB36-C1]WSI04386.1 Maf family protein [Sedimentibacter sp. MB36-C1]
MKKIILASKSPRRIEMLSNYANVINRYIPEVKESVNPKDKPQTTVMKIAIEKANNVHDICDEKGLIIAADTIVYLHKVMGKPSNYDEAFSMLKYLSGKSHKVYTGICIIDNVTGKRIVDYEETTVEFIKFDDDFIKRYLNTGEYKDKAGGYGIQGYGELLVKKIDGCYNNVKGLPLVKLNNLCAKHFSEKLL